MHAVRVMRYLPRAMRSQTRQLLLAHTHRTLHIHPCLQCSDQHILSTELQARSFSKVSDSQATELYFEEIFEHGFSGEDPLFDLRNYFYPESDDPVIIQLSHAGCVIEVLECITQMEEIKHQHITQAVATLHHLRKLSGFVGQANHYEDYRSNQFEFNTQLNEQEMFGRLCSIIQENLKEIPNNELGFLLMALSKFQVPLSSLVMRNIYLHLQDNMDTLDIETLSYMSVGLRPRFHPDRFRFVWRLGLVKAMPRLQHLLVTCETPEDLRKVVICYCNMAILISDKMMGQLVVKVTEFIESGALGSQHEYKHISLLNKLLSLLVAKNDWHEQNGNFVHLLLSQFTGKTKFLSPVNTVMLSKIVKSCGEPASLYFEVYQRLCEIIETKQFLGNLPMISCLSNVLQVNPSAIPLKDVEDLLEDIINSHHLGDHVNDVYEIMRTVGIINNELVDKFYLKSFEALKNEPSSELLRFAVKYTNMYSTYTGVYYNQDFERKVVDFVLKEMNSRDPISLHPYEFSKRIGLLITFGQQLDENLYQKLKDMLPKLCTRGLLSISRGIDYQSRKLKRDTLSVSSNPIPRNQKSSHTDWIEEVSVLVNKASAVKLGERSGVNIIDLAYLMKNFSSRSAFYDEDLFSFVTSSLIEKVNQGNVSIQLVGQICGALNPRNLRVENSELVKCFVNFFLSRPDPHDVHTNMFRKLMSYCFDTGNVPDQRFLDIVSHNLHRDIDSLPGVNCLQVANILCSFNSMSKPLVSALFSNEFMGRLDKELDMAANRRHYPKILRRNLMELNRGVVLRYPEYGVPWFHSKYCVENQHELKQRRSFEGQTLKTEVSEQLNALTGGWRFVKEDSHSEYYNHIDFEVQYDERGHPVDLHSKHNVGKKVKKFAIQVLPANAFTINTRNLAGSEKSNTRELELQGWNVISVNPFSWNSLQMGEDRAKKQFLEQTIAQAVVL